MRFSHFALLVALSAFMANCQGSKEVLYPNDPVRFSQDFLLAIKTEQPYTAYRDTLAQIDLQRLKTDLNDADQKLAFWINTYNSLVQAKIKDNPATFGDQKKFFNTADQNIGGKMLSLDDIENGILRKKDRSHEKKFFKEFQVDALDPRIHFTLNCGAASCPPIAYYSPEKLENDLTLAEESFVRQTTAMDPYTNSVSISEIFKWYAEDFGGEEGVLQLLDRLGLVDANEPASITYTPYDWHLDVENYDE